MGNTESSEGASGEPGLPLPSLDGYAAWWGGGAAEGVGAPADQEAVQAAFALVEEPPGARTLAPPRELDFAHAAVAGDTVTMDSAALAVHSEWGASEEDASSHSSEGQGDGAAEEEEMSRLVGRDGYLLPFATNAYHLHKVAQLHHLHHEDAGLNEHLIDDIKPNESIFFRYSAPCCAPSSSRAGKCLAMSFAITDLLIFIMSLSVLPHPTDLRGRDQGGLQAADTSGKGTPNKLYMTCRPENRSSFASMVQGEHISAVDYVSMCIFASRPGPESSDQSYKNRPLRTLKGLRCVKNAWDPQVSFGSPAHEASEGRKAFRNYADFTVCEQTGLYEDFERISKSVAHERGRNDEANIDSAARGMVAPSREVKLCPPLTSPILLNSNLSALRAIYNRLSRREDRIFPVCVFLPRWPGCILQ
jgi:hypothetical protein